MNDTDSYSFSLAAILLTFAGLFMFADASTDRNRIASAQTQACCAERDPKTGQCIRRERCAVEVAYQGPQMGPQMTNGSAVLSCITPGATCRPNGPDPGLCKSPSDTGRFWINTKSKAAWTCWNPGAGWHAMNSSKGSAGGEPSTSSSLAAQTPGDMACHWIVDDYVCDEEVVGYVSRERDIYGKPTGFWYAMFRDHAIGKFVTRSAAARRVEREAHTAIPVMAINEGKCLPPGCCMPGNRCPV